jgi:hypothetical protein
MKDFITFDNYVIPGGSEALTLHANKPGLEINFYSHRQNWQRSRPLCFNSIFLFFATQEMVLLVTLGNALHTALSFISPRYEYSHKLQLYVISVFSFIFVINNIPARCNATSSAMVGSVIGTEVSNLGANFTINQPNSQTLIASLSYAFAVFSS